MVAGVTLKHMIFSLNVDTGATRSGWPVDVNAKARYNGLTFTSSIQNQRGALGFLNGVVYVPYYCAAPAATAATIMAGLLACQLATLRL